MEFRRSGVDLVILLLLLCTPAYLLHRLFATSRVIGRVPVIATGGDHDIMADAVHIDVVVDAKTDLGEAPTWDARIQRLYFVDINSKNIQYWDLESDQHVVIDAPEMVGTVALTADPNTILAAMHRTIVPLDVQAKSFGKPLLEVPEDHGVDSMRFNDGKGSPGGAFIVGRMHSRWRDGEPGRLYRADVKTGKLEELLGPEEVGLPNGMAWDTARRTMYFVDTYAGTVTAYGTDEAGVPVKGADGKLKARCVVKVPKEDGIPDGMTIDRDGNLWVALAEGAAIGCYDPDTGDLKRKVQLPVKKPLACTFGGPDLDQLFVTTRIEKGDGASEHWGSILSVRVPGVKGVDGGYPVST